MTRAFFEPALKTCKRDAILKLNIADHAFLSELERKTFDYIPFFKSLYNSCNLDFILKIAHASNKFELLCQNEAYDSLWSSQFQLLGNFISASQQPVPVSFYEHPDADNFNLLRGAYWYYLSQQERSKSRTEFCFEERMLLLEAVKFHSVHAVQRYNQYINTQINNINDLAEKYSLINDVINYCKSILAVNGSYAYMMLAEAYLQYMFIAIAAGDLKKVNGAYKAASKACDLAEKNLSLSKYSIYNASLGNGLQRSNSFEYSTPAQLKTYISDSLRNADIANPDILSPRM